MKKKQGALFLSRTIFTDPTPTRNWMRMLESVIFFQMSNLCSIWMGCTLILWQHRRLPTAFVLWQARRLSILWEKSNKDRQSMRLYTGRRQHKECWICKMLRKNVSRMWITLQCGNFFTLHKCCRTPFHAGSASGTKKKNQPETKRKRLTFTKKKPVLLVSPGDLPLDLKIAEEVNAEAGFEPVGHRWTEEQCTILWSYIEDFQEELYHGKDNLTRPQVVAKITTMLSTQKFWTPPFFLQHKLSQRSPLCWVHKNSGPPLLSTTQNAWHINVETCSCRCETQQGFWQEGRGQQNSSNWKTLSCTWEFKAQWCNGLTILASRGQDSSCHRSVVITGVCFSVSCTHKFPSTSHPHIFPVTGDRPMIKPATISSFRQDDNKENNTQSDVPVPSTSSGSNTKKIDIETKQGWSSSNLPEKFCEYMSWPTGHQCVPVAFRTSCMPSSAGQGRNWDPQWKSRVQKTAHWASGQGKTKRKKMTKFACLLSTHELLLFSWLFHKAVVFHSDGWSITGRCWCNGQGMRNGSTLMTNFTCWIRRKTLSATVLLNVCTFFQLMDLPGELLTEILTYLDPRSQLHLTQVHPYFSKFMEAKWLWKDLRLTNNWVFHNDTFVFIRRFATKVETVVIDHTGRTPRYIVTYAEGMLANMPNIRKISVRSPYFQFCHFLKHTSQVEVLQFKQCPRFDTESFVECAQSGCLSQLRTLNMRGVTGLSSMDMWRLSNHLPYLTQLYLVTVMSDIFAEEVFENCQSLTHFDCIAPEWCLVEWRTLKHRYAWIQLGPQLSSCL